MLSDEKETEQIAAGPSSEMKINFSAGVRRYGEKQRFFREIEITDFCKFAVV